MSKKASRIRVLGDAKPTIPQTKTARRVNLFVEKQKEEDLAKEIVYTRQRIELQEKRQENETLQKQVSDLKDAITQLEFCIIENTPEDKVKIQDTLNEIKSKIAGLEAITSGINNGLADLSTQISSINISSGGQEVSTLVAPFSSVTDGGRFMYWRTNASAPTYPGSPPLVAWNASSNPIFEHGMGRIREVYGNDYRYVQYLRVRFPVTAEVRKNWEGIGGVTVRLAACGYRAGSVYVVPHNFADSITAHQTAYSTYEYAKCPENRSPVGSFIVNAVKGGSGQSYFAGSGEINLGKSYWGAIDINTTDYLDVFVSSNVEGQQRSDTNSSGRSYSPAMGLVPHMREEEEIFRKLQMSPENDAKLFFTLN